MEGRRQLQALPTVVAASIALLHVAMWPFQRLAYSTKLLVVSSVLVSKRCACRLKPPLCRRHGEASDGEAESRLSISLADSADTGRVPGFSGNPEAQVAMEVPRHRMAAAAQEKVVPGTWEEHPPIRHRSWRTREPFGVGFEPHIYVDPRWPETPEAAQSHAAHRTFAGGREHDFETMPRANES